MLLRGLSVGDRDLKDCAPQHDVSLELILDGTANYSRTHSNAKAQIRKCAACSGKICRNTERDSWLPFDSTFFCAYRSAPILTDTGPRQRASAFSNKHGMAAAKTVAPLPEMRMWCK